MVKEGSTWRAVATCSTPQGPFRIEAVADEKALLAAGVPLPAVSDATATAAKTAVLNKVGCMNWGARRYEEALFERLKRGETAAFALVNRLKVYEKTNPKAAKILRRLRELRVQSLQGSPSSSGWPWPTKVGAGIDLDSQPRPRKNLSSHTLFRLQSAMKRAV
jgi:hypothetical protein